MAYQDTLFVTDHKEAYRRIRDFLAGRFVGATRDRALLEEVVRCLFCKAYLKRHGLQEGAKEPSELATLYKKTFAELRDALPSVFDSSEAISLDSASIAFVDEKLESVDLKDAERDPFGDLYEVFVGTGVREEEGQFFTPQNGVEALVELTNPQPGERIIDPACGAGGFVSSVLQHLLSQGISSEEAASSVFGIEKDAYLRKLAATRCSLLTLLSSNIYCADSLAWIDRDENELSLPCNESYDVVLTNPPFGKRIVSTSRGVQKTFDLGAKWRKSRKTERYERTRELPRSVPPQVLFVERCLSLLRPGGRLGIVVPESLITSKSYKHVVQYLRARGSINAVLGMPESFFKTSGKGGTHTKVCLVSYTKDLPEANAKTSIFMAEAEYCGHGSRGQRIERDDLPAIMRNFESFSNGGLLTQEQNHLGYVLPAQKVVDHTLSPRYYDPEVKATLELLQETHDLVKLGDLLDSGLLKKSTGHEVGRAAYGTGSVPFVRTSDLSNWEIKIDPKHCVSEDIYEEYAARQDVQAGDVLMVKDGTYLIGTCALVTEYDTRMVYQSHVYKLRSTDPDKLSPYLLLAVLSSDPVQRQIKSKRFTQDIIDSLGRRINELTLPIPTSKAHRDRVTAMVRQAIRDRIEARELARRARVDVVEAE